MAMEPDMPEATRIQAWPIERAYLATLKDLGLSDGQVACYFRVDENEVATLCASYGIAGRGNKIRPARRPRASAGAGGGWRLRARRSP